MSPDHKSSHKGYDDWWLTAAETSKIIFFLSPRLNKQTYKKKNRQTFPWKTDKTFKIKSERFRQVTSCYLLWSQENIRAPLSLLHASDRYPTKQNKIMTHQEVSLYTFCISQHNSSLELSINWTQSQNPGTPQGT